MVVGIPKERFNAKTIMRMTKFCIDIVAYHFFIMIRAVGCGNWFICMTI